MNRLIMENTEVILQTPGTTKIIPANKPTPKDDEVLIKVEYVGICGSDVHSFQFGPYIKPKDPNQKIGLGHECAGTVIAVGGNVTKFKPGDRVAVEPGVPCGKCKYCRTGRYNICPDVDFMATQPNYRSALTQYLTHPESFTYHLPDTMSTMEGALVEPAAVGVHAARIGNAHGGMDITILGCGCIGLMTLQACRMAGARNIICVDTIPARLEMARKFGASVIVNASNEDAVTRIASLLELGADLVYETAGSPVTAAQAVQIVGRGGRIVMVGTQSSEVPVNFLKINREVEIITSFRYANDYPTTIEAIACGDMDVKSMVTHRYEYSQVQKAFEDSVNKKAEIVKGVIHLSD